MREFSKMRAIDVWYFNVEAEEVLEHFEGGAAKRRIEKRIEKARNRDVLDDDFPEMVTFENGAHRIRDNPPLIYHDQSDATTAVESNIHEAFARYRSTLTEDRRVILDRYELKDIARKVVGVGSVGTRCGILLMMGGSARQDFSRKLKWDPSDFSGEKLSWRLLPSAARVRPASAAAHNSPSVRCTPLAYANDLTPCRMALHFDYASAAAPTSSKRPAPTATRGSSYTAPLALRFLYSFAEDPLFLQFKEARASVLEPYAGKSSYANHGQRVVMGQRLIQPVSDIFLGWAEGKLGNHFYIRQLRDMKIKPQVEIFEPSTMKVFADLCGWALAAAHARSGDSAKIAGYLGKKEDFDEAIADFAEAYADQNESDHQALVRAVREGRLEVYLER